MLYYSCWMDFKLFFVISKCMNSVLDDDNTEQYRFYEWCFVFVNTCSLFFVVKTWLWTKELPSKRLWKIKYGSNFNLFLKLKLVVYKFRLSHRLLKFTIFNFNLSNWKINHTTIVFFPLNFTSETSVKK